MKRQIKPSRGLKITETFFLLFNLVPQGTCLVSLPFVKQFSVCSLFCNEHLFAFIALQMSFLLGTKFIQSRICQNQSCCAHLFPTGFQFRNSHAQNYSLQREKNLLILQHYIEGNKFHSVSFTFNIVCKGGKHTTFIFNRSSL